MSDKKDQQLPQSSSGSSPSDPQLERLLGAIAKGLDGLVEGNTRIANNLDAIVEGNTTLVSNQEALVQGNLELRRAFTDLRKVVGQHHSRTETRITDLQIAVDQFVLRIEAVIEHQKIAAGASYTAGRALVDSKNSLDTSVAELKEATGTIRTMRGEHAEDAEGNAPLAVRKWSAEAGVKIANFVWPIAVRQGTRVTRVVYIAASTAFFGFLKIVYETIHRAIYG